jgi:hypothetical protein
MTELVLTFIYDSTMIHHILYIKLNIEDLRHAQLEAVGQSLYLYYIMYQINKYNNK